MLTSNDVVDVTNSGLSPAVIAKIKGVLTEFPAIEKTVLYGSRAKGNYRAGSDIDLAIIGDQMTDTQLLALENRLDDLSLPYGFDLALVHNIKNQALLDHIHRVGILFFESPKSTTEPPRVRP